MALINSIKTVRTGAVQTMGRATLTSSDTFNYVPNTNMILELHNNTAGALTPVIKGSAPSAAFPIPGAGDTTISLTAGLSIPVGINQSVAVNLDAIAAYLDGTGLVTITAGTGITASIITN